MNQSLIAWFVPGVIAFCASWCFWRYAMSVAREAFDHGAEALHGWRESNDLMIEVIAVHRREHAERGIKCVFAVLLAAAHVRRIDQQADAFRGEP